MHTGPLVVLTWLPHTGMREAVELVLALCAGSRQFGMSLAFTFLAWRNGWQNGARKSAAYEDTHDRQRFVARVAAIMGLFSSVVIVAQWLPLWGLSPCFA